MSKVYITNASFKMISKSLQYKKCYHNREELLKIIAKDFEFEFETENFIDNIKQFYNSNELKDIYFTKKLLEDFAGVLKNIEGNKEIITDYIKKSNSIYAFKTNTPAFHTDSSCKWMKNDFKNIIIPENCNLSIEKRQKAIKWLSDNKNLLFFELNSKFKIEFECDCDLEEVERSNSGEIEYDNEQINFKLYSETLKTFKQMRMFFDGEFAKKVQYFKYASSHNLKKMLHNYKDTEYYNTIIDFHTMKDVTKQMFIKYYQYKLNIDLSFDQSLLESIGFRKCSGCAK